MTKDRSLGIVGIKMPVKYVAEMFADRVAACKTYEKDRYTTMSPWRYYKRTKEYITIHPETRKLWNACSNDWQLKARMKYTAICDI